MSAAPTTGSTSLVSWRTALFVAPTLYVGVAAARAGEARALAWVLLAGGAMVAILGARVPRSNPDLRARALLLGGLSLALATAGWPHPSHWVGLVRACVSAVAVVAAIRSIAAITEEPGLGPAATAAETAGTLGPRGIARAGLAAACVALGGAALVNGAAWLAPRSGLADAATLVSAGAGAFALFGIGATALVVARARRLELGAPPKALACAAMAGLGLVLALTLALGNVTSADAATTLGTSLTALAIVRLASALDALMVARIARRTFALAIFGSPAVALAAVAAEGHAAGAVLFFAGLCVLVGALGEKLEEPFLPMRGVFLDALVQAARFTQDRDSREAIANALVHLRQAAGQAGQPAELWMLHPSRVRTVDAAGYARERRGELPPLLFEMARGEPFDTVRLEVLRALEVRRASLRPLLRWLEDRGALFATLIRAADGEPEGVLIVPSGGRFEPLSIDEAAAAKRLADGFVAICQAESARERHQDRERDLNRRIDDLQDKVAELDHLTALDVGKNALAAHRLARPATVGIYSATSRMAYETLERRVIQNAPIALVARPGVDPVPYIARAHLAGPRHEGPLVVVDGTSSREHDAERWRDRNVSPLALADGGLLVLVDGAALPRDIQVTVARALGERRPPWERALPLDVTLALTATRTPEVLQEEGLLAPELASRLEGASPIELPRLRDRSEDLRAIVADRLAREGLRVHGRPIGIDAAAFALLVEHPFEGEDAELAAIVTRVVQRVRGDVVTTAELGDLLTLTPSRPEENLFRKRS